MPRPSTAKLETLLRKTWINFKRNFNLYWQVIGVMFIGMLIISLIDSLASGQGSEIIKDKEITVATLVTANLFYQGVLFIFLFMWLIFTQGLIIHVSISQTKVKFAALIKDFKNDYLRFLALSITFAVSALAAMIPFYAASLILLSDIPGKIVIANLLLILFVASLLGVTWFFIFTPFVMLDKHLSLVKSLRYNLTLIKGHFWKIIGLLIIPLVILIVLNLTMMTIPNRQLSILAYFAYLFVILPMLYSYLAEIYFSHDQA